MARVGSRKRIAEFLLSNVGRVLTADEIREAANGASEWARRLRELRDEQGWLIRSHNDDAALRPGEYRLDGPPPEQKDVRFSRAISAKLRAEVLERNGFTCQMCGLAPDETDPETGRKARMHIGHIIDKSLGGKDEIANLRTLCSTCNQGAKNVISERPTALWLLAQVRRAGLDEQQAVFDFLKRKFGG